MTGFGEASQRADGISYVVELRSLNNKYFKATIRLPEEIASLEAELEATLRRCINRGSITLVAKVSVAELSAHPHINEALLGAYLSHLEKMAANIADQQRTAHIDLAALLGLPGVITTSDEEQTLLRRVRPVLIRLVEQACGRLAVMRATEGETIAQELAKHRAIILDRIELIKARTPQVVEEYHKRLRARIDELLVKAKLKVDEHDLIREVAIYAERSDIAEEVMRMLAHLEQMESIVESSIGDPTGRTLDFLAQELLREANTIASKSNDAAVSRAIVEVKGAIDRIKEQVQNVE